VAFFCQACSVNKGSAHIVHGQRRVTVRYLISANSCRQVRQNHVYRNTGAANARFTVTDVWVHSNSVQKVLVFHVTSPFLPQIPSYRFTVVGEVRVPSP